MIYAARFNGVLIPETESRLRAHLEASDAYQGPAGKNGINPDILVERLETAPCHRLGLDVCLSATGPRMALRHHILHLRGMAPIAFMATARAGSGTPKTYPDGADPARLDAIAWLAGLAHLRFRLTPAPSAHAHRAEIRAQAERDHGTIAPSPLAFDARDIAAAMQVLDGGRRGADFPDTVALLHAAAAPETLSPGWGAALAAEAS